MVLNNITKLEYKNNTFTKLELYKELWYIRNGFFSQDHIIELFYDAFGKREIRFDNIDDFYTNNRQLLLKYLPELHINLKTIASKELQDLLQNSGLKITSGTSSKSKLKTDSKTTGKDKTKQKSKSDNIQSSTPANYSSNNKDFMNQLFNKSVGDGDVENEREQNNLVIVDNDNNVINETIQKSLIDTIIKITQMKSSSIILEWLNHFDILFSNYSYDIGNFGDEWINTTQYQQLLEKIDDIQRNAESKAAKIATKWVQEHYKEIAKYVPTQKGDPGEPGKPGKDGEPGKPGKDGDGSGDMIWKQFNKDYFTLHENTIFPMNEIDGYTTISETTNIKNKLENLKIDVNNKLFNIDNKLDNKADKNYVYNKTDIDNKLDDKADRNYVYNKFVIDNKLDYKADKYDVYEKYIIDKKLNNIYTKNEVDDKIDNIETSDTIFKKSPGGGEWSKIDDLPLGMNQSRISELKTPESDDDAATKKYVDDRVYLLLQELGFSKEQLQEANNKIEKLYQLSIKKEPNND